MQEINISKARTVEEQWLPLTKAQRRWGNQELVERVKSGSVRARRDPKDRRFWEFQLVTDKKAVTATLNKKLKTQTESNKALDNKAFLKFQKANPCELNEEDFDMGAREDETSDEDSEKLD
eukprot:1514346-Pyramimonas_sp.AAC.1